MPNPIEVFISHSAKDKFTESVLQQLYEMLNNLKFKVRKVESHFIPLLDRNDIQSAAIWERTIANWLRDCQASILLICENFFKSDFVKQRELPILMDRAITGQDHFILIPISLSGITECDIKKRLPLHNITQYQCVSVPKMNNPKDVVQYIAEKIKSRLEDLCKRMQFAMHEFPAYFINYLGKYYQEDQLLDLACEIVGTKVFGARKRDLLITIAKALFDPDLPLGQQRFKRLKWFADSLRKVPHQWSEKEKILDVIFPYCWVDPQLAHHLVPSKKNQLFAWGRKWDKSEKMHINRAFQNSKPIILQLSGNTSGAENDLRKMVHKCLAIKLLPAFDFTKITSEQINDQIHKLSHQDNGQPVFMIISADIVDDMLALALHEEWPELRLFLHKPDWTREQFETWHIPDFLYLTPSLKVEDEQVAIVEWCLLFSNSAQ